MTVIERQADNQKKARRSGGFTIAETLVTIIILMLVSGGVASGIRFGVEQYHKSMLLSEAKVLCSTLTSVIQGELSDTGTVTLGASVDGTDEVREVKTFFSPRYAISDAPTALIPVTVTGSGAARTISAAEDGCGELLLGTVVNETTGKAKGNLLLNSAAYTTYQLRANASISYDKTHKLFNVTLRIYPSDDTEPIMESSFDVLPLNDVKIE